MELFRKNNSKYYWYDFAVRGERVREAHDPTAATFAGEVELADSEVEVLNLLGFSWAAG